MFIEGDEHASDPLCGSGMLSTVERPGGIFRSPGADTCVFRAFYKHLVPAGQLEAGLRCRASDTQNPLPKREGTVREVGDGNH